MREILFRGKRRDDSTWVYGSLQCFKGFSIFDNDLKSFITVNSNTIGQYTGLIDKNGKKIFEGDIIKCHVEYNVGCYPHTETETIVVRYSDGCFIPFSRCEKDFYEVIGNIHDNPELLEEKK